MAQSPSEKAFDQCPSAAAPAELRSLLAQLVADAMRQLASGTAPLATRYVRTDAAARYLTLDPTTLADWRHEPGKGPAYRKIGGRVVYSVADLDAWLERHPLQGGALQ